MSVRRLTGAVLLAAGGAIAVEGFTFAVAFMTDPVGPKALPWLVAVMLAVPGVIVLLRPGEEPDLPDRDAVVRMAGAILAFLVYAAALPFLGFFTSTTLVMTALALLYRGPPLASVAASAALSGGLWLLFVRILSLPLPVGELWIL